MQAGSQENEDNFKRTNMKELWGAAKLEAELAAAKEDLRGVEKNIRKILGRDAPDGENGVVQQNNRYDLCLVFLCLNLTYHRLRCVL